MRFPISD